MPIRINLLAEYREAEEARRRDPVKRALYIGGSLVGMLLVFSASLQVRLISLRGTLTSSETRLAAIEADSSAVQSDWQTIGEMQERQELLFRYATNRLLGATMLDTLQRSIVDGVRVVSLTTAHNFATNAETKFKTNVSFTLPTKSKWRFWSTPPKADFTLALNEQLAKFTNRAEILTSKHPFATKITWKTNTIAGRVTAEVELKRPVTANETVSLTISARDYGKVPGQKVDVFSRAITNETYFANLLAKGGEAIRVKDLGIRPDYEATDWEKTKPFVPFTLVCRYDDRIRANE